MAFSTANSDVADCAGCVLLRDMKRGKTRVVTDPVDDASLSGDGNAIVYTRWNIDADNPELFAQDIATGATRNVARNAAGEPATSSDSHNIFGRLSDDGSKVVFVSNADNLGRPGAHYRAWAARGIERQQRGES